MAGTVKLYAAVAPDRTVKAVEPVGGSPLLVQASQKRRKTIEICPHQLLSQELSNCISTHKDCPQKVIFSAIKTDGILAAPAFERTKSARKWSAKLPSPR